MTLIDYVATLTLKECAAIVEDGCSDLQWRLKLITDVISCDALRDAARARLEAAV